MTEISEDIIDNCGFKSSKTQQFYSDSSKSASATVIAIDIIIDLYNLYHLLYQPRPWTLTE
jgi:hypothetical protein